ncbi:SRPBCC family protein [Pedobacter sp. Du54]|uniref:SRPBCC family protein n=1 Tax=Pedobacter anseongensis TaxID=3133439 RepID=UPI0030AF423D
MLEISESTIVKASVDKVFEKLLNPEEQLKWNTLYLEVHTEPKGTIKNGTVMTGKFKGSGKAKVYFENIIPNQEFTHYSKLKMFNIIYLGEFRHNYKLENSDGKTKITQTVFFNPKGIGKLLQIPIAKSFKDRIPVSFEEFKNYIDLEE